MSDTILIEPVVETVTVNPAAAPAVTVQPATTPVTVEAGQAASVAVQPAAAAKVVVTPVQPTVNVLAGPPGPPGPPGPAGGSAVVWTNFDASPHVLGDVVYLGAADGAKKAKADADTTANAVAVCAQVSVAGGAPGNYQISGVLAGLSGLIVNAVYYLSALTAGLLTTTAPTAVGAWIVEIGVAVSATELLIRPRLLIAL